LSGDFGSLGCWGERAGRGGLYSNMWIGLSGGAAVGLFWLEGRDLVRMEENGDLTQHGLWLSKDELRD
jgi:hypothetical protein